MLHRRIGTSLLQFSADKPAIHILAVNQVNLSCTDVEDLSQEQRSQFAQANALGKRWLRSADLGIHSAELGWAGSAQPGNHSAEVS